MQCHYNYMPPKTLLDMAEFCKRGRYDNETVAALTSRTACKSCFIYMRACVTAYGTLLVTSFVCPGVTLLHRLSVLNGAYLCVPSLTKICFTDDIKHTSPKCKVDLCTSLYSTLVTLIKY